MYNSCLLCNRACGVNREAGEVGFCRSGASPRVARAALHIWEEPPISGTRGSGAIFFSGCSVGCIYCQNKQISSAEYGKEITDERLAQIMLELQGAGAHNINLVTPTHFVPSVINAVSMAKNHGLTIPIVYNTASYETRKSLKSLAGTVDVWLPDLKYYKASTAERYSSASDLPIKAREAIDEMVRMAPVPRFDNGIMTSGVMVRILLLPGHLAEAKLNVGYLYSAYGDSIYISLMSQYTPSSALPTPLNRRVTREEYRELVGYAERMGVKNAFIQDISSASDTYVPEFNNCGV